MCSPGNVASLKPLGIKAHFLQCAHRTDVEKTLKTQLIYIKTVHFGYHNSSVLLDRNLQSGRPYNILA